MTTIEERLRSDAVYESTSADWEGVVERAGARADTQKTVFRAAVAAFVLLAGVAWLLGGGSPTDTIDSVDLAQPTPLDDPNAAPWSEPSPVGIMAAWFLAWGGSLIAGTLTYYLSARHLRAPYIFARQTRIASAVASIANWNAFLLALTIVAASIVQVDLLRWLYPDVRWMFLASFVVFGLIVIFTADTGVVRMVIFLAVVAALAGGTIAANFEEVTTSFGPTVSLFTIVALVLLLNHSFRQLGYELDRTRMQNLSAARLTWRRTFGAVLIIGGLSAAVIAMAPTAVVRSQMSVLAPNVDGFQRTVWSEAFHPLFRWEAPELFVNYSASSEEADILILMRYLEGQGFESRLDAMPSDFAGRRPRGDAFGALNVDLSLESSPQLHVYVEESSPFDLGSVIRNLGYALAWAGLLLIWSETAISRFLAGPNPWRRQSHIRERVGWAVVIFAGLFPIASVVNERFASSLSGSFFLELLLSVPVWLFGAWLLAPKAPASTES